MMQGEQLAFFMNRWHEMLKAKHSHPYAEWVAVDDQSCDESCLKLHQKLFKVDGALLKYTFDKHQSEPKLKPCRCRIRPISTFRFKHENLICED